MGEEGKTVIYNSSEEEQKADRQKDPERGEEGGDPGDDEEKAGSVGEQPDLALSGAFSGVDGDEFDAEATAQIAQGKSRGVGEGVGQEVDELSGHREPHQAKTGGEIPYRELRHIGSEFIVDPVGEITVALGFRLPCPRPHHHVEIFPVFEKPGNVFRVVLAIGIHHHHPLPHGIAQPRFNRRPVADIVGVRQYAGPLGGRYLRRVVARAVVDHQHFEVCIQLQQALNGGADALSLVVGGEQYGHGGMIVIGHEGMWAMTL